LLAGRSVRHVVEEFEIAVELNRDLECLHRKLLDILGGTTTETWSTRLVWGGFTLDAFVLPIVRSSL
jgi:hypothetical protein